MRDFDSMVHGELLQYVVLDFKNNEKKVVCQVSSAQY